MIQPRPHIADETLSAAIDDQLTPEEAREANAHLETCSVCQARLDELRSVVGLLRALPEVELPRDFSIGPRLVADPPNVVRLRRWYGVARAGAASLAAAFVFLSAGALFVESQPVSNSQVQAGRPQLASAPAAERQNDVPTQSGSTVAPVGAVAAKVAAPAQAPTPAAPARPAAQAPQAPAAAGAPVPAPDSARSQAAPAASSGEVADQVTAATSVRPLPTPVPTPVPTAVPIPTQAPQPVAPLPFSTASAETATPLRTAAVIVGILTALGLLITLVVRQRLRAAGTSP